MNQSILTTQILITFTEKSYLHHTLVLQPSHSTSLSLRLWLHTFCPPLYLFCRNSPRAWRSLQPAPHNSLHICHYPRAAHGFSSASHMETPKDKEHINFAFLISCGSKGQISLVVTTWFGVAEVAWKKILHQLHQMFSAFPAYFSVYILLKSCISAQFCASTQNNIKRKKYSTKNKRSTLKRVYEETHLCFLIHGYNITVL